MSSQEHDYRWFLRIPLAIRLSIAVVFLAITTVATLGLVDLYFLTIASVGLLLLGGLQITRARTLIVAFVAVPLLMALSISHFDWHRPFVVRYIEGSFYLVAVALLVDSIRFEEWIFILTRRQLGSTLEQLREHLIAVIFGVAVGRTAVFHAIQSEQDTRKLAHIDRWNTKTRVAFWLDRVATPIRSAFEGLDSLDYAIRSWRIPDLGPEITDERIVESSKLFFANSRQTAQLTDVYDFPFFSEFIERVFETAPIATEWQNHIRKIQHVDKVIEIGAGTGRFTKKLLERGLTVTVIERHEPYCQMLMRLADEMPGMLNVIRGVFPGAVTDSYNYIILHQNVFVEIANQIGMHETLCALNSIRATGGRIWFDYPMEFIPNSSGTIYDEDISNLGKITYAYSEYKCTGKWHSAMLTYELSRVTETFYVRTLLAFTLPEFSEVQRDSDMLQLKVYLIPINDGFTFFPSQLGFVELAD